VAIFLRRHMLDDLIDIEERVENFAQCLKLSFPTFDVITVYRNQICKKAHYSQLFLNMLGGLIDSDKRTIVTGDFNFEFWKRPPSVLAQNMEQMGLSQIVKTPTTVHGNCIDHVYLTKGETEVDHKIYYPYYTNHEAIVVILKGWKRNITRSRIRKELKRKKAK